MYAVTTSNTKYYRKAFDTALQAWAFCSPALYDKPVCVIGSEHTARGLRFDPDLLALESLFFAVVDKVHPVLAAHLRQDGPTQSEASRASGSRTVALARNYFNDRRDTNSLREYLYRARLKDSSWNIDELYWVYVPDSDDEE